MKITITSQEIQELKKYIFEACRIELSEGSKINLNSHFSRLFLETGCTSYSEFKDKIDIDFDKRLRDRVIDALTANETFWFRDEHHWNYMKDYAVPQLLDRAEAGANPRVWCCAVSTGQEAYSLAMLVHEEAIHRRKPGLAEKVSILGTDISPSSLYMAIAGKYDVMSMGRGLSIKRRNMYFNQVGRIWSLQDLFLDRVEFKRFNLMDDFTTFGAFDLVLCRNVLLYYLPEFKKDFFSRLAKSLNSGNILVLGRSEDLSELSSDFTPKKLKNCIINVKK